MSNFFLRMGLVTIVIIIAGINVKLNDSTNSVVLSLSNIEVLSDECGCGCGYTLIPRICYKGSDITANIYSGRSYEDCHSNGNICANTSTRGYLREYASEYVCHYKKY
jgi:hypothetical protein